MHSFLLLAALTSVSASTVQYPVLEPSNSQALISSSKGLVSSKALQGDISSENLLKRANHLYELAKLSQDEYNHPTRVIGSKGHLATVDYIYSTIADLGDYYTITNQTFQAVKVKILESRLVLGGNVLKSAIPMRLTPPTKDKKTVYGPLVLVANDGCYQDDYPSYLTGSIALIRRGTCSFGVKSALAGKNGAIAAVVYNNEEGSLSGTLVDPVEDHVATFGISDTDAMPYIEKLKAGETIPSSAYMNAMVNKIETTNIIAQTKEGDAENCVMLGGHSDSVGVGPGINDDGSGTLTLLEVATQLTKYSVNNCVRFAWWTAEEVGLVGSDYYVAHLSQEENLKIRLFMDYDMLASPNYAYQVYNATDSANPTGSEELRDLYVDFYESEGQNYTFIDFDGRSDYDAFIKNGIPGGGIATGAEKAKTKEEAEMFGGVVGASFDPCYHELCDNVDNLNMTAWELNTRLVAHSVATYANTLKGFPLRTFVENTVRRDKTTDFHYHGHELIM